VRLIQFLVEIAASKIGKYIANDSEHQYTKNHLKFNPRMRGLIVEKIIFEIIRSLFFNNKLYVSPNKIEAIKYVDLVFSKYYQRFLRVPSDQVRMLKSYLLNLVSNINYNELRNLVLGTNYSEMMDNRYIDTQKIIQTNISGFLVTAKVDIWITIGEQIIIGEIKDRIWNFPFPNIGDLVQTLIASQIAYKKRLNVRYIWIYYAPIHSYHCFGYLPQIESLLTETLVRYTHSLPSNGDDWCKLLYRNPYVNPRRGRNGS